MEALSSAMDIPFPVMGGIMQMLSPIRHSAVADARSVQSEIPATAAKVAFSNVASSSRAWIVSPISDEKI